jgi:hypothetical protein
VSEVKIQEYVKKEEDDVKDLRKEVEEYKSTLQ